MTTVVASTGNVTRATGSQRQHPYARFARAAGRLVPASSRAAAEEKALERSSPELLKALAFTRFNVTPLEVEMAAYATFIGVFLAGTILGVILAGMTGATGVTLAMYAGGIAGGIALIATLVVSNFPKTHAKALRARTAGQLPEAISYLALSMQLNPSLTKAVEFAAGHAREPIAGSLRNVLWRVYLRERPRVEDAYLDFALEWGEWNDDFKKSLYTVRAAELEATPEGRSATLDKATTAMYKGARAVIEDFALSLNAPTTVFFAFGIILPMLIGALLPLMAMGNRSMHPVVIVLMFNVAFPAITFAYSWGILQRRPGTSPLPQIETTLTPAERALVLVTVLGSLAGSLFVAYLALTVGSLGFLGYLPFLWAAGIPIAAYAYLTSRRAKAERDRIRKLEQEYPDALYQLGSRIGEGVPVEKALSQTADAMQGTHIAGLLALAAYRLQVMKSSLEETLFGEDGVLTRQPSRLVEGTMRVVVGATKKEAQTAGRTIVSVSTYLREMITVEREIRNRLSDVTDTMLTTARVFAPAVLGVTVALNLMMAASFGNVDLSGLPGGFGLAGGSAEEGPPAPTLSPNALGLVMGIYLLLTLITSTYFVSGIRNGDDRIEWKWMLGNALPMGLLLYSVAVIAVRFIIR